MPAADRPSLTAEERSELGSRVTRRLRREGFVPGIVYGAGEAGTTPFRVGARDLRKALLDASAVIDLKIDGGKARPVIVKDQQLHPVRGEVVHIDLLQVDLSEKIHSTVAVELEGGESAPGVKEGGVLEHITRELNIEALPTDIPENVTVDVSGMEIAGTMTLSELTAPEGVTFLDDPDETVIATIGMPSDVVEEEGVEEETALVGEDAEGAQGETGEESEAASEGGDESS